MTLHLLSAYGRMAADIGGKGKRQYRSVKQCIMEIVKHAGVGAIYRGWVFASFGAFIYR